MRTLANIALLALTALVTTPSPTRAESAPPPAPMTRLWLQEETLVRDRSDVVTALNALSLTPLSERVALFAAMYVSKQYSEAYVGPAMFLGPLTIGLGIGLEQWEPSFRTGMVANLRLEKFGATGYLEYGGSGPWARLTAFALPLPWLGIGGMAQADFGAGPYLELSPYPEKQPATIFGAPLVSLRDGTVTGYAGLRLSL